MCLQKHFCTWPGISDSVGNCKRTSSSDELQNAVFYKACAPPAAASDGGSQRHTVGGLIGERP